MHGEKERVKANNPALPSCSWGILTQDLSVELNTYHEYFHVYIIAIINPLLEVMREGVPPNKTLLIFSSY